MYPGPPKIHRDAWAGVLRKPAEIWVLAWYFSHEIALILAPSLVQIRTNSLLDFQGLVLVRMKLLWPSRQMG